MACADLANLGQAVRKLEKAGVDLLHFDFCDGHFAPTFLLSPPILRSIRRLTSLRFDVHLYCDYPSRYVDELAGCGADLVAVHVESKENCRDVVSQIRRKGMKAGLAILPETAVPASIEGVLADVSLVIANTVGPAYPGQEFDRRGLKNIKRMSDIIKTGPWGGDIAADGGVGLKTLDELLNAGANLLIGGTTSIFRPGKDPADGVKSLRKRIGIQNAACDSVHATS